MVYAVERGRRRPTRGLLVSIGRAVSLDTYRLNRLLRRAGRRLQGTPAHRRGGHSGVRLDADRLGWPCFVLDTDCNVVWANPMANRLVDWRSTPALPGRAGPHLVQIVVRQDFRERLLNWDEVVRIVLPGRLRLFVLGRPAGKDERGLLEVASQVRRQEPEGLKRLVEAWRTPAPVVNAQQSHRPNRMADR